MLISITAYSQDFLVEKDLRLDWTFYSQDEQTVLPFLDANDESPYAIHLLHDLDYGKGTFLKVQIPAASSLFIENKFVFHFDKDTTRLFSIDSLRSQLSRDYLYLTLYSKAGFEAPPASSIGFLRRDFDTDMNVNPISHREIDARNDYIKIIILLVFTFFVLLHTLLPSELREFYSIGSLFTFRYTDTYLTKYRIITKTQTLVIVYQAAMLAAIMIVSLHYYNNPLGASFVMRVNPIFGWMMIFALTLALIFFKYILITIVSYLFGISDRINFYFVEYLRMAMIFYSMIFAVISYVVINRFYALDGLLKALIVIVIIFNFLRLIVIYFKFQRNISIKNLHLFSYLCSTELIPIVIGLNFFVK
jgi:hypothetical protein